VVKKKAKKKVRQARTKARKVKKAVRVRKAKGEKVLGVAEHFFGNISVAAIKLKAPLKAEDFIHIKGHTTDFVQKIESMQINHQNVLKAKKGDDIGIKVREKVRTGDIVYLSKDKPLAIAYPAINPRLPLRFSGSQTPKPALPKTPPPKKPEPKPADPYSNIKFLGF